MEDFNRILNEWKGQYLQFIATGDDASKQAYQRAQQAIEETIAAKRARVDSEKAAMKQFANSYAKSNSDLSSSVAGAQSLVDNAQAIHDSYVTSRDRFNEWTSTDKPAPPTLDVSNGYSILLRIGIFLILLPVLLFVGYLVPGAGQAAAQGVTSISLSPALSPQP
jgi:hypothetical protein